MNATADSTARDSRTDSIIVEYDIAAPVSTVWRALTESELIAQWLMPNDFQPVVGHRFTFSTKPMPGWDGVVECEVLEVTPETHLSYSWRGGPGESRLDSVVTWTLEPAGNGGTKLLLDHSGFTEGNRMAFEGLSKGWRGPVGDRLLGVVGGL